jgi:streptogramin lyase
MLRFVGVEYPASHRRTLPKACLLDSIFVFSERFLLPLTSFCGSRAVYSAPVTPAATTTPAGSRWEPGVMTYALRAVWNAGAMLSCSIFALAQLPPSITEYPIPSSSGIPQGITVGTDGALWFTESGGEIGRVTTAGIFTEYPVPTAAGNPTGISAGPDGALWFTEQYGNKIGRITTAGVITEYTIPTVGSQPFGIAAGPDGALWFTEFAPSGNKIGRITTTGTFTEYLIPTASSSPDGIIAGPDGALWFVEQSGNNIGRITTSGTLTEYTIPTADSALWDITSGPDGALWFVEYNAAQLGRITTAGSVTEYPMPTTPSLPDAIAAGPDGALWFADSSGARIGRAVPGPTISEFARTGQPAEITAGPDGALWFTDLSGNKIGRVTTGGTITEFALPTMFSQPQGITAGPDGALWFTEFNVGKIGRITTAGAITEYTIPTAQSYPYGITTGPDGALWFTEEFSNKIGRITTAGAIKEYTIPTTPVTEPHFITAGPDGALWFTEYHSGKIGRITTAGAITEYTISEPSSQPWGIVAGPDGALWFTEYNPNNNSNIGRITAAGVFSQYSTPTTRSGPTVITVGADGALWFTEYYSGKLGRITTAGLVDEYPTPGPGVPGGISAGPDGAIWFTDLAYYLTGRATLPLARPSVEPASGSGLSQMLTVRFTDAAGASNISVADVLTNSVLDGQNACYLAYVPSSNTLYLVDNGGDGGGPYAGSLVLNGSGGSIQNSQCQISGVGSAATSTGTTLVLTLNVTFESAFAGNRVMHLAQVNQSGYTSGWQRVGVWQVPGSPTAKIITDGQNPSRDVATGGIDQPLAFTITDTGGFKNVGVVDVLINDFLDGVGACYVAYVESTNTLYLVDDGGDAGGPFAGALLLNGSGSIENSQCRIDGAGSSAKGSGDTLMLTLDIFFYEGFAGNHAVYSAARDSAGNNNTGWQAVGTWSVQ